MGKRKHTPKQEQARLRHTNSHVNEYGGEKQEDLRQILRRVAQETGFNDKELRQFLAGRANLSNGDYPLLKAAFAKVGGLEKARELFQSLPQRDHSPR